MFQDWGTGLGHVFNRALLPSPLGPLHATSTPCPPCPCARLQSPHSTIPQDSWGISQAIPVPDTCPVMSPAVQWPSLLLTSFWGSGSPSQIGDGERGEAGTFLREVAGMPCVPWGPGVGSQGPPQWKRRADTLTLADSSPQKPLGIFCSLNI